MSTKDTVKDLLSSLNQLFLDNERRAAEFVMLALSDLVRDENKLVKLVNELDGVNTRLGFFPPTYSLEKSFLLSSRFGIKGIQTLGGYDFENDSMVVSVGTGPALFEARVIIDPSTISFRDDNYSNHLHIRTLFYFGGDDTLPKGIYFRLYDDDGDYDVLADPFGRWRDPRLVPIDKSLFYNRNKQDLSLKHKALTKAFEICLHKDLS